MSQYIPAPSPHTHAPLSIGRIMFTVWLAMLPASLYGVWLYGWPALNLLLLTTAAALAAEAFRSSPPCRMAQHWSPPGCWR